MDYWREYYLQEPFGAWRDNYHASMVSTVLWNTNYKNKKNVGDFFFKDVDTKRVNETNKTLQTLLAMAETSDD